MTYVPHSNLEFLGVDGARAISVKEVESLPAKIEK